LNGGYNYLGSSRFVEDGSFVRLKYISLNYDIPKRLINKIKFAGARIGMTLKNLYTWTNYTGQDPEISLKEKDLFYIGFDNSRTPRTKEFQFNISLSF